MLRRVLMVFFGFWMPMVSAHAVDSYKPLGDFAAEFGFGVVERSAKVVQLAKGSLKLKFTLHARHFYLGARKVHLGAPVAFRRGELCIGRSDIQHTLRPLLQPYGLRTRPPSLTYVLIDPGHGGKDVGAASRNLLEKDLNLRLAAMIGARLRTHGIRVGFTRGSDKFLALSERASLSKNSGADLFVSLHFNSARSTQASGAEVYVLTPRLQPSTGSTLLGSSSRVTYAGHALNDWSTIAGFLVQDALVKYTRTTDRGLKRARFAVLKNVRVPAILVEGGFISNRNEAARLRSSAYLSKMADGIVDGILRYGRVVQRARGLSRNP